MKSETIKIIRIEAENLHIGKRYSWSADMLLWDELPKWLLERIEIELPNYQIEVYYF